MNNMKSIKEYSEVKVGDKVQRVEGGTYSGTVEWVGTARELVYSDEYSGLLDLEEFGVETPEDLDDMYNLVVVKSDDWEGLTLFNYNNDPTGVVVLSEKIQVNLLGKDGNIFNLVGLAVQALKEAGQKENAEELKKRVFHGESKSYHQSLAIIMEYIEII